jgi:hypothetical protein
MRKLHVISIQKSYLDIIVYQLAEIFGDKVELSAMTLQEMTAGLIAEEDIVLLSKDILIGITRSFIPASCPIIIANREVNIISTSALHKLPKGQQILVINDTVEHAEETAISLENIYFEHEYIAYDPMDLIPSTIDWIVTPGEMELVPKGFPNVIDIGPRGLDFNTVSQIAELLYVEYNLVAVMNRFIKSQLSLTQQMDEHEKVRYEKTLKQQSKKQIESEESSSLSAKTINKIIGKIEEHGFLEESLSILEIYNETKKNFELIGRTKVKMKLRDAGIKLSDQQLRLRLEVMQDLGLLIARPGRGGTKLSSKGEVFLRQNRDLDC